MSHELRHLVSEAPRVMVVDGSKLVRKLIGDVLAKELPGVEVLACAGLAEARAALLTDPANAALADLLASNYRQKVELLRRATQLDPRS